MSASADAVLSRYLSADRASYPVAASTTLYKAAMISVVAGYAQALTDGTRFDGHAVAKANNSSGSAGDIEVEVLTGKYLLEVTLDNVNRYMVGAFVYAVDDNTYTLAPMMTPVGRVKQYVSTDKAIVEFDTNISRKTMGGCVGVFEPFFQNINDGNVETNNSGVAKTWTRTSVNGAGIIRALQKTATPTSPYCNGLEIIPDTAENDSESLQMSGEMFFLGATTKPVFFGCRIQVADADQVDTIIGLSITDTALLNGISDGITWRIADASAAAELYVEKDSTETASSGAATMADATAKSLGFLYDGTNVYPYVDGVARTGLVVTNLPNNEGLTVSIEHTAGAASEAGLIVYFLDAYQLL